MITHATVSPLVFKPDLAPSNGWLNYGLVITILLILIVLLTKHNKSRIQSHAGCQLIEKKSLGNKTMIYIVEYQKQRFLLADNQQALSIHPVDSAPIAQEPSSIAETRPSLGVVLKTHEAPHAPK